MFRLWVFTVFGESHSSCAAWETERPSRRRSSTRARLAELCRGTPRVARDGEARRPSSSRARRGLRRPGAHRAPHGHARVHQWRRRLSEAVSRRREMNVGMGVPVRRLVRAGQLHGPFEVLDRRMEIRPAHQGTAKGKVRVGRSDTGRVADFLGESERVPCQSFRTFAVSATELDEREVRQREDACRTMPPAVQGAGLLQKCARLIGPSVEEERLSQRHEARVSPFAFSRLIRARALPSARRRRCHG